MSVPVGANAEPSRMVWPNGFEQLYRDRYEHMVRLSALVIGRVSVAEELVQNVFVEVATRWDDIETPAAYLRTSVVNRSRTAARRAARERPRPQVPDRVTPPDEPSLQHLHPVWQAVERLSPRRRAAVVLRFYEGLDTEEIASILECRPATVRSLVHRALRQLERSLS